MHGLFEAQWGGNTSTHVGPAMLGRWDEEKYIRTNFGRDRVIDERP